jgi:DeoR/GlpR family transcriptional regulator of sugar metabolism
MPDKKSMRRLFSAERERLIFDELGRDAKSIEELALSLGVSTATVRRDLLSLENKGRVKRVHGGAMRSDMLICEPLFSEKRLIREEEKSLIAEKAASFVRDGEAIYLDGGSTVLGMCACLAGRKNLSIVTNSLMAASELMEDGHKLFIVGGRFRPLSRTIVGALTEKTLASMSFDKAFLGTIGISEEGISTTDPDEAYTKELVMRRSETVVLLADASKFGKRSLALSGGLSDIDVIISGRSPPANFAKLCKKTKIKIIF